MANQATYVDNGRRSAAGESPGKHSKAAARGFGEILHDATVLAELQVKLATVEAKETAGQMVAPLALAISAVCLALGAVTTLLIACGYWMVAAGLSVHVSMFLATAIGLVLAGLLAGTGYMLIRSRLAAFARSREEFSRNLRWMKESFKAAR